MNLNILEIGSNPESIAKNEIDKIQTKTQNRILSIA